MSHTKYYKILGLLPGADQAAIRKAFRKLAMRYHPDKNPSASAQTKFIAITEAYEILIGKKSAPAERVSRARSRQTQPGASNSGIRKEKTQADRVREAKERQEAQAKRESEENERYFQLLTTGWRWKVMRWSAIVGLVLSVCLIAERFLPHHFTQEKIAKYALTPDLSSGSEQISVIQTEQDNVYCISRISYDLYGRHTRIYVRSSWIFHEPIQLLSIGKTEYAPYNVHFTFYSNFGVMIFLLLLPSITVLMKNRTIMFTILHKISYYAVNILILYFLFRNDHWAHILTFGFL